MQLDIDHVTCYHTVFVNVVKIDAIKATLKRG